MESFERFIQALEDLYNEKGDVKILRLKAQIRRYRSQVEKHGMSISDADREIGKIVADVISGHPVEDAIRFIESRISELTVRRPPSPLAVNINIPHIDAVGEDKAIVHVTISNRSGITIKAQALKVLDERGIIVETLPFEETIIDPKKILEKSFTLRTGTYIFKFTFMPEEKHEILEVERKVEVKPPTLPRLNIELLNPPHRARLAPPLTFRVRVTSAGKPVQNADVTFHMKNEESSIQRVLKTDIEGYAKFEDWDPGWSYEATLNWWAEASKVGYEKGISEKRIVIYIPIEEEMRRWLEERIERIKVFIRKMESEFI
ncbi:MAG: hypothetical protein QW385_00580 [Thermoproteota archaeon]